MVLTSEIDKQLQSGSDEIHANSKFKSSEYSILILGLIFLRYADFEFSLVQQGLDDNSAKSERRRRGVSKADYQACGVMFFA